MQIIDINSMDQGAVYMMYEMFKSIKQNLESNGNLTEVEEQNIIHLEAQLTHIEKWADEKLNEKLHWTKEDILTNYGHKPTLIINFHPSTESYKKYGNEIVANVKFTDEELLEMFTNIQNKAERKSNVVNFTLIPTNIDGTFETKDIFELAGRKI
ncbi:hypothetical protein ACM55I_05405 [Flavobacterium sp. GB2R13]|uniref:hypothetical protein n=1 Tax=Flavobacterium algoris TaxID=3398733 RepID=UPI003A893545